MRTLEDFRGVFSLLLTPFNEDGSIAWNTYDYYIDWQLSHNPQGLFAVCGTSEMKWLERPERLELARRAVARSGSKPVVATANLDPNLDTHQEEVQAMADTGVEGIVLVPPDGMGTNEGELKEYFSRLAAQAPCPVFIYEWPQVSPHLISSETFFNLVHEIGIMGIKDTTCTFAGIKGKIDAAGDKALVYQANTPHLVDALQAGAGGIMAITSSCYPDLVTSLWNSYPRDTLAVKEIHQRLVQLDALLRFAYPATAKYLLQLRGLPFTTKTRWPVELTEESQKVLSMFVE